MLIKSRPRSISCAFLSVGSAKVISPRTGGTLSVGRMVYYSFYILVLFITLLLHTVLFIPYLRT